MLQYLRDQLDVTLQAKQAALPDDKRFFAVAAADILESSLTLLTPGSLPSLWWLQLAHELFDPINTVAGEALKNPWEVLERSIPLLDAWTNPTSFVSLCSTLKRRHGMPGGDHVWDRMFQAIHQHMQTNATSPVATFVNEVKRYATEVGSILAIEWLAMHAPETLPVFPVVTTNKVHVWIAKALQPLIQRHVGIDWRDVANRVERCRTPDSATLTDHRGMLEGGMKYYAGQIRLVPTLPTLPVGHGLVAVWGGETNEKWRCICTHRNRRATLIRTSPHWQLVPVIPPQPFILLGGEGTVLRDNNGSIDINSMGLTTKFHSLNENGINTCVKNPSHEALSCWHLQLARKACDFASVSTRASVTNVRQLIPVLANIVVDYLYAEEECIEVE